ncbi:MAG: hypothetical protein QM705_00180 [Ancrocorticia sp.]
MSDQVVQGYFWLPNSPQNRWPGALTISDDDNELELMYPEVNREQLQEHAMSNRKVPILFGSLLGMGDVTIRGALPSGGIRHTTTVSSVGYWMFDLLIGAHVSGEIYSSLSLDVEWLAEWAPLPRMCQHHGDELVISLSEETLLSTQVSKARIEFVRQVDHSESLLETTTGQGCFLNIKNKGPLDDLITDWVGPIQDLMLIALGHRPGVLKILVECPIDEELSPIWVEYQPSLQDIGASGTHPRLIDRLGYSKTILLPNDNLIDFGCIITKWFISEKELGVPVAMLNSASRAGNMHAEHRYLTLFIAIDALAKLSNEIDTKAMPSEDFDQRITVLEQALDQDSIGDDIRGWALNILRNKNQKSQKRIIGDFLLQSELFSPEDTRRIAAVLSNVRVQIAHNGVIRGISSDDVAHRVFYLATMMEWLVRAELLVRLGTPRKSVVSRLEANSLFRWVRKGVIESLPKARQK